MDWLHQLTTWMAAHREYARLGMIISGYVFLFFFGMFVQQHLPR